MFKDSVCTFLVFSLCKLFCATYGKFLEVPELPPIACPNYFQYVNNGDSYFGKITLPNIQEGAQVDVKFSQRGELNNIGSLSLNQDDETRSKNIESEQPISYRVDFPLANVVPKLTEIAITSMVICAASEYPSPSTSFQLKHILRTSVTKSRVRRSKRNNLDVLICQLFSPVQSGNESVSEPDCDSDNLDELLKAIFKASSSNLTTTEPTTRSVQPNDEEPKNDKLDEVINEIFWTASSYLTTTGSVQPNDEEPKTRTQSSPSSLSIRQLQTNIELVPPVQSDNEAVCGLDCLIEDIFGRSSSNLTTTGSVQPNDEEPKNRAQSSTPQRSQSLEPQETKPQQPQQQMLLQRESDRESVCGLEGDTDHYLSPFINGGKPIRRGEYPWLTAIYRKHVYGSNFICGGSLITSNLVLSAAHCFDFLTSDKISVTFGRYNLSDSMEDVVSRDILNLIRHPEYKRGDSRFPDADLALLRIFDVSFTSFIRPICLWNESDDESLIVGQSAMVAGWGTDENNNPSQVPKKVESKVVSDRQCLSSSNRFINIKSERTLCAGNRDGTGPCHGDSGGGLMVLRNNRWVLRGIVSAGQTEQLRCNLLEYVIYCDIAKHMWWVRQYMEQL